jgi:cysteine-rich repeat protein
MDATPLAHTPQRRVRIAALIALLLAGLVAVVPARVEAQADLIDDFGGPDGFGEDTLEPSDDGSSGAISVTEAFPSGLNFFGSIHRTLFINNNGNITFTGPVSLFIPEPFPVSERPMIAPFWGDVDTRVQTGSAVNTVYYYLDAANGRFVVTWYEVGYFSFHIDLINSFQLILTDRSDVVAGDFDVEFRYNRCEWSTGDETETGQGGVPAQAGFDAGNGVDYETLPGSRTDAIRRLCETSNVDDPGVWRFNIRIGDVTTCGNGVVEDDEVCDDGGDSEACDGDCTLPECGDGYANELVLESCDDGNATAGDGCSDVCRVEDGWLCVPDQRTGTDICSPICGDGMVVGGEACDDGNTDAEDGCSATCEVESGWVCDDAEPSECLPDGDGDGVPDSLDNCPDTPNRDQADADDDGVGDACDSAEPAPDAGPDVGPDLGGPYELSGGGACAVSGSRGGADAAGWLAVVGVVALVAVSRRRRG